MIVMSLVKRQSQTGVISFSRALSTITIQNKEIDKQNPGYDQLWNNTRPSYENISVLNDPKLKMCIYSHSKAPMVHQVRLHAV